MRRISLDKEPLEQMYCVQRMSATAIAKKLGVGHNTVYRALRRYGLAVHSISDAKMREDFTGTCVVCGKDIVSKSKCKSCYNKESYQRHAEKRRQYNKARRQTESYKQWQSKHMKQYRQEKPEMFREIGRRYRANSEQAAMRHRLRERLRQAFLHQGIQKCQTSKKYGIDYSRILEYIGPCPGPRTDWHIDHIQPLCSFDLRDIKQVQTAFAPENHQWLRAEENLAKGASIPSSVISVTASRGD